MALQSDYAAVGYLADSFGQFCTGTLVSSTQVLTASHCLDDDADGQIDSEINLSDIDFRLDADIPAVGTPNIASAAIHPAWVSSNGSADFDVAVLTHYGDVSDWAALRNPQNLAFLAGLNI